MKVLFICKGNWYRSQMAEAIYNQLTHSHDAFSAGTFVNAKDELEGQVLSALFDKKSFFFEVLETHGLSLQNNRTKKLLPEMLQQYNVIVSMAEEPYIPSFLKADKNVIWWDVKDGGDTTLESMTAKYNEIEGLVRGLIAEHNIKIGQ